MAPMSPTALADQTTRVPAARWPGRAAPLAPSRRPRNRRRMVLVAGDGVAVTGALAVAVVTRSDAGPGQAVGQPAYCAVVCLLGCAWLLALGLAGCYRTRHLGAAGEEYRRTISGTLRLWVAVIVLAYLADLDSVRGLIAALPLGLVLLLAGRWLAGNHLVARRLHGELTNRVILVGYPCDAVVLAGALRRERAAGFEVIGVCVPDPITRPVPGGPPVLGTIEDLPAVVTAYRADTVLVAAPNVRPDTVRRLAWALEGNPVDLLVAPGLMDVAGSRVSVHPVAGLPLLHVDQPQFTGGQRLAKDVFDRILAGLGLVLLGPLLLVLAATVRLSSPGPALFSQPRSGRDGVPFRVYKFRTMYADAGTRLATLTGHNEADGLLFKIRADPRVTPLGRLLRRTSLDELPQLLNVLRGQMSLVGPRPLPVADCAFTGDVRRRLLVRPGITGLWQVSGRSRLTWQDTVRLDLYYVDNWSIGLDLAILLRTAGAVIRGVGAY